MAHTIKIVKIDKLTHNVLRIRTEKPINLSYSVGQTAKISISKPGWKTNVRSLTITSIPTENYIEFVVKIIPSQQGTISQFASADIGNTIYLHEIIDGITYKGEGLFIAGGSGIAPFIAILKELERKDKIGNNILLFANKTKRDIILEVPFKKLLGDQFISILSDEKLEAYEHGFITKEMIKRHIFSSQQYFYLCGPLPMMNAIENELTQLNITETQIIKQQFS